MANVCTAYGFVPKASTHTSLTGPKSDQELPMYVPLSRHDSFLVTHRWGIYNRSRPGDLCGKYLVLSMMESP